MKKLHTKNKHNKEQIEGTEKMFENKTKIEGKKIGRRECRDDNLASCG